MEKATKSQSTAEKTFRKLFALASDGKQWSAHHGTVTQIP
jgi:hypothetical protein